MRLLVCGLLLGLGSMASAQEITGVWQGTLPGAENPRIVLKFGRSDEGALRGSFYWIDRFADSIPLSSLSYAAPAVSLASVATGTGFAGRVSADGKQLAGTWTQEGKAYPLTLARTAPADVWTHEEPGAAAAAMASTADPSFEVATVKPSAPGVRATTYAMRTRQFRASNATVGALVRLAYKMRSRQIEGAPAWFDEQRFDIAAEPDTPGVPNEDQSRTMLKKLLAERFGLTFHTVRRPFSVYALTVEKGPAKVTRSEPDGSAHGRIVTNPMPDGQMLAQFVNDSMPEFADVLMNFIPERQIVDETGLVGRFDFSMTVPMSVLQSADENEKATAFFAAVQTLGFKLVPKKESLRVMVIERLEKPSEN